MNKSTDDNKDVLAAAKAAFRLANLSLSIAKASPQLKGKTGALSEDEEKIALELFRLLYIGRVFQLVQKSKKTFRPSFFEKVDVCWNSLKSEALNLQRKELEKKVVAIKKDVSQLEKEDVNKSCIRITELKKRIIELKGLMDAANNFLFSTIDRLSLDDIKKVSAKPIYKMAAAHFYTKLLKQLNSISGPSTTDKILAAVQEHAPELCTPDTLKAIIKKHDRKKYLIARDLTAIRYGKKPDVIKKHIDEGRGEIRLFLTPDLVRDLVPLFFSKKPRHN